MGDSRTHAQMGMFGWLADYPHPATFYDPAFSCHGLQRTSPQNLNLSQLCDRVLDGLIAKAKTAEGPEAEDAWIAVRNRFDRIAPAVPLVSRFRTLFVSPRAGNVRQNPFLGPLLEQIWVQ